MNKGDRVKTKINYDAGTVVEYLGDFDFPKVRVLLDGASDPVVFYEDALTIYSSEEQELERVLVIAENSESSDAIMLASEVRSLRARLEAVCDVVSDAAAYGDAVESADILEAVRGQREVRQKEISFLGWVLRRVKRWRGTVLKSAWMGT